MKKLLDSHADLIILGVLVLALAFIYWDTKLPRLYKDEQHKLLSVVEPTPTPQPEPIDVRFTSYHIGDYSGSTDTTASGLTINDFEVNDFGWYTYQGKVVLAAATYGCLRATTGACGQYMSLPEGYSIHELFDEVTMYLNGTSYQGIVLDACGYCMRMNPNEELQRYDIFVSEVKYVADTQGYILVE